MHTVSATSLQRNSGDVLNNALEEPVIIKNHKRETHALLNIKEFRFLNKARELLNDLLLGREIDKAKKGEYIEMEEAITRLKAYANDKTH